MGDSYRYICQIYSHDKTQDCFVIPDDDQNAVELALQSYQDARKLLNSEKDKKSILFLTIRLNELLFKYDYQNKKESSYQKLKLLFDTHLGMLSQCSEEQTKDYTQVLNAIENNLELWRLEIDHQ
jgi:hypothetical protein